MINREFIKSRMSALGLSFRTFALAAGWGEHNGPRIERIISGDTTDPGFSSMVGIADALGVSVDELREDRADRPNPHWRGMIAEAARVVAPIPTVNPDGATTSLMSVEPFEDASFLREEFTRLAELIVDRYRAANPTPVPERPARGNPNRVGGRFVTGEAARSAAMPVITDRDSLTQTTVSAGV